MPLNTSTQGLGSPIVKDSEMQTAINRCSGTVNTVFKRAEELAEKLQPMLRCDSDKPGCCPAEQPSSVPMIQQIDTETEKLRGVVNIMDNLLARLPL